MRKIFCAILSLLVLGSCSESSTIDAFSDITGTVIDLETSNPIDGVTITLAPTGKSSVTGADGYFEFLDLEAKQYTLTVQKTGYSTNRKIVNAVAGEEESVSITLQKQK
ncbi:MAG: carboxypeptidase-like regulatory domain-containing protein [Bacteroidales bacterium]|nr:carboxypeptidase-like regulatory domain-containing protein [Bacteroidales bacterium]